MHLSILMLDSQAGQVEGLFSLHKMLFSHDYVVMTMGLSIMSSPVDAGFNLDV